MEDLLRPKPVPVIFDTDMRSDCDDAGALACLHALADLGSAQILGVIADTTGPHIVACIDAINTYYGRPGIPIGLTPVPELSGMDDYAPTLADNSNFPSRLINATAPDSTALYRRLLNEAADDSVWIVGVGSQSPVHRLMLSEANHLNDGILLSGMELIRRKVQTLVLMAGNFADPQKRGWNAKLDPKAAMVVASDWPGRIVYTDYMIGRAIMTGARLTNPEANPVALAYKLCPHAGEPGIIGNRHSWDQTAVLYAVMGLHYESNRVWTLSPSHRISFDLDARSAAVFDATANRFFLQTHMPPPMVAGIIESLMIRPPADLS